MSIPSEQQNVPRHDGTYDHDGTIYHDGTFEHRLREYEQEFDVKNVRYRNASIHRRPDAVSPDYLTAFSTGPQQLGDPNGDRGILNRMWRVRVDGQHVFISRTDKSFSGL